MRKLAASEEQRHRHPTIREVAGLAGVSTATVSNVLNDRRFVGAERRARVLDAVETLGYRPNSIAASMRSQRTRIVGIVVPDISNVFFSAVVRRFEQLAAGSGYQIILVSCNEDPEVEAGRIGALLAQRVDGLVVVPSADAFASLAEIQRNHVPVVVVDRGDAGLADVDMISANNETAACSATEHLLGLGHRKITLLATTPEIANIRERIAGYRRALATAGLAAAVRIEIVGKTAESSRLAALRVLGAVDRPTALFTATSDATLGAVQAIRELGLDFPAAISLLGFDDHEWMTVLKPYLSTVRQPVDEMVGQAWSVLLRRLGEGAPGFKRLRLSCTLCVRESTLPPQAR